MLTLLLAWLRDDLPPIQTGTLPVAETGRDGVTFWHGEYHGEPGATVTIEPSLPAEHGPVYFYRNPTNGIIWPDPSLSETTEDGSVLFLDVPPGRYTLRAQKAGVTFDERAMWCRADWLVNASPPFGLNAL